MASTSSRKVTVVTTTRADYGLLYWLLKEIADDAKLELQLVVSGTHLQEQFGNTQQAIVDDGFPIAARVPLPLDDDSTLGVSRAMAAATAGFAECFASLRPEIVVVLGDRYEVLCAAQAAMIARIPIAHIHGGEATEGLIDEAIRHAVTKMAHLHFVAANEYRKRVIQLGEQPDRVFCFGAPGLDQIVRTRLLSKKELETSISFELGPRSFLVTYHPVTLSSAASKDTFGELLRALDAFPEAHVIITMPNADPGRSEIAQLVERYRTTNPARVFVTHSLGQLRYLSALAHVDVVIGNSSSGIIEVPLFKKPTVDVGDRQRGRLAASSVIRCDERVSEIESAIHRALSPEFRSIAANAKSLYGDGNASAKIKDILATFDLRGILMKRFYDIGFDA